MNWGKLGGGLTLAVASVVGMCVATAWGMPLKTAQYWHAYESMLVSKGLMRADRSPADAPYTSADLVRDFKAIMLHDEYSRRGAGFAKNAAARTLKKLTSPVGVDISGSTLSATDLANIRDMMARLSRVTGVRMVEGSQDPVIRLMILNEAERQAFAHEVATSPRWGFIAQNVANELGSAVCSTYYSHDRMRPGRVDYIIVIPAEVQGMLRRSCIEEEMGQTFGPGADSDQARPSIFNDDAEFALMTTHDEDLLRILYDPRLKPGMTAEQAMPLVVRIASELRPGR